MRFVDPKETLPMNITRLSGFINTSTQSSTNRSMLTVALKDYHMLIGEFLLKQIQQIHTRNLKSKYLFFSSQDGTVISVPNMNNQLAMAIAS